MLWVCTVISQACNFGKGADESLSELSFFSELKVDSTLLEVMQLCIWDFIVRAFKSEPVAPWLTGQNPNQA